MRMKRRIVALILCLVCAPILAFGEGAVRFALTDGALFALRSNRVEPVAVGVAAYAQLGELAYYLTEDELGDGLALYRYDGASRSVGRVIAVDVPSGGALSVKAANGQIRIEWNTKEERGSMALPLLQADEIAERAGAKTEAFAIEDLFAGDAGEAVKRLQNRLIELDCLTGSADGEYGASTADAVKRFENMMGFAETGAASRELQKELFAVDAPEYDPYRALRKGETSVRVKDLQRRLIALKYPAGSASGVYGTKTARAVKLFQGDHGFVEKTRVSASELKRLYETGKKYRRYRQLAPGDSGERVYLMQQRLKKLDYFEGTLSGAYDAYTQDCVLRFQENADLEASGIATEKTLKTLYGKDAPRDETA